MAVESQLNSSCNSHTNVDWVEHPLCVQLGQMESMQCRRLSMLLQTRHQVLTQFEVAV